MSLVVDIKKHFRDFSLNVRFTSSGRPLAILGASGSVRRRFVWRSMKVCSSFP